MSPQLHLPPTKWSKAAGIGLAASLIVLFVVLAFLWPSKATSAQNLPVSIAGPPATATAFEETVSQQSPGVFDFVDATDRKEAIRQIETREAYGAVILGDGGAAPEVLTAPAAGTAATQMLTGIAAELQARLTQQSTATGGDPTAAKVAVTPVVQLSDSDPAGTGLAAASFPMTMGGLIGGILVSMLVTGAARRLATLAGFGVAAGIGLALVLQTWFEYIQGNFWLNAVAIGLSVLATASLITGCRSLLGTKGIGLGVVITMFIGNPISSAATPWQFLTEPWGQIGQIFVPGASNWLLRSLSYFPDTNLAPQWWTLIAWTAVGTILTLTAHFRYRTAAPSLAPVSPDEADMKTVQA